MIGTVILFAAMFFALVGLAVWDGARFGGILLFAVMIIGGIGGLLLYFLPTIFAVVRRHRQAAPIILLNVFLGWTFLGWIAALIWSVADFRQTR